jgi:hypothetical protein
MPKLTDRSRLGQKNFDRLLIAPPLAHIVAGSGAKAVSFPVRSSIVVASIVLLLRINTQTVQNLYEKIGTFLCRFTIRASEIYDGVASLNSKSCCSFVHRARHAGVSRSLIVIRDRRSLWSFRSAFRFSRRRRRRGGWRLGKAEWRRCQKRSSRRKD